MNSNLITTAEFADLTRTSPETVRYWRFRGIGPVGFKVGRRVLYREDDVVAWLDDAHKQAMREAEPESRRSPAPAATRAQSRQQPRPEAASLKASPPVATATAYGRHAGSRRSTGRSAAAPSTPH